MFGSFFRQFGWALPSRGQWEIEVTRISTSEANPNYSRRVYLSAVQSFRPEYPVNLDTMTAPLALISIKIRASYQLNGTLDSLNALVSRYAPDWDGADWTEATTRNPASLYAYALQGPANPRPVTDDQIDWEALADWHDFCEAKGLHYDRDHRASVSLGDMLREIAAAGRASPWHDGTKWSVIIDQPQDIEVDHISPRNSRNFTGQRTYVDTPDAVRVRFRDEENDYEEAEVVVPWPGASAPYSLVEQWQAPGKTSGEEIAREIYRQMQVVENRRDRWTVEQDGGMRVATRGDWVRLSHYVLSDTQAAGRVLSVTGALVVLDETVTMEDGESYGLRFLQYDSGDPVGQSVLTTVQTVPGATRTLHVTGDDVPPADALVMFGPVSEESFQALVLGVEPGQEFSATLTLTNAAPEIDTATDAYTPTDWDPTVGAIVDVGIDPLAPVFAGIATLPVEGEYGTDTRTLRVPITQAADEKALIAGYELDHRLQGAGSWTTVEVSYAAELSYDHDDVVELRARAEDFDGDFGAYTATSTFTVGSDLAALPAEIDLESVTVTAGLGVASITVAVGDANTAYVAIFRTEDGVTFDSDTDLIGAGAAEADEDFLGQPVAGGQPVNYTDGDSTRTDLLGSTYTAGGGWGSTTLPSTHTPGSASTLSQAVTFTNGETYRGEITISGRTAGSVTVEMTGGSPEVSSAAISANGQTLFSLDADGGNDTFAVVATSDFDGTVDSLTLYRETAACAPQGVYEYRFAALNIDGIGSAVSSEIEVTII